MMEDGNERNHRDEIFSNAVRAGKRTYFFDVKTTRGNDLYLTITESKKRYNKDGRFYYEKHKLFLYKEDFEKFSDGLTEAIDKIQELRASGEYEPVESSGYSEDGHEGKQNNKNSYTEVNFDDLGGNGSPKTSETTSSSSSTEE